MFSSLMTMLKISSTSSSLVGLKSVVMGGGMAWLKSTGLMRHGCLMSLPVCNEKKEMGMLSFSSSANGEQNRKGETSDAASKSSNETYENDVGTSKASEGSNENTVKGGGGSKIQEQKGDPSQGGTANLWYRWAGDASGSQDAKPSKVQRIAQERIANILMGEDSVVGEQKLRTKRGYGILGTAKDAPSVNPAFTRRADEISPDRIHPHRLFYPGMTYTPEELNPFVDKRTNAYDQMNVSRRGGTVRLPKKVIASSLDFRNVKFLSNFLTETGKIMSRRKTQFPAKYHRSLSRKIKLARTMALLCPITKVTPMLTHGRIIQRGENTQKQSQQSDT